MSAGPPPPTKPSDALTRFLDALERVGNRLPDPLTIFVGIATLTLSVAALGAALGWHAVHPADGRLIEVRTLLDAEGIRRVLTEAVRNFTGFAPLGTVLVAMLGIGVAEGSGLIGAALRASVLGAPRSWLTPTVLFTGVMANVAADAGVVMLPPIAAVLYASFGRHPLVGVAAAFAGVTGGFSANLLPSPLDVLLAGLSQSALDASKLAPGYTVQVLGNWWFLIASTPVLVIVGTWVTDHVVEPRLGPWRPESAPDPAQPLTAAERRGLGAALLATLAGGAAVAALVLAPGAPLRDTTATGIAQLKPFFDSMVILIAGLFFVPGLVYGLVSGSIRSDRDVARMATESMASMASFLVLAFVAGQVAQWFAWSNLGALVAIRGADGLRAAGLEGAPLLVAFVAFSASVNLMMTSASAKWAILAPVFVPMFTLLGYTPEATQVVFRIGDSCTNIVTPLMPYLPFILATARRYTPEFGVGQLMTLMLPYTVVFLVSWTLLLVLWLALGLPIGPGVGFELPR